MQIFNIKSLTMLAFFWVKGHASINQGTATPLLHAVFFKVALQLFTSIHSSHANRFMNRLDEENRLTTFVWKDSVQ